MPVERISVEQYRAMLASQSGSNKYGAQRTEFDGRVFDSRAEAERYAELRLLERAGLISGLECQPVYVLQDGPRETRVTYRADFAYVEDGRRVVEDVKGVETALWRLKAKLFVERFPHLVLRVVRAGGETEEFGGMTE